MDDFDLPIPDQLLGLINEHIERYRENRTNPDYLIQLENLLPEGFMQTRTWMVSYKTLRNIILQRHDHRQPGWREVFVPYILECAAHREFLQMV